MQGRAGLHEPVEGRGARRDIPGDGRRDAQRQGGLVRCTRLRYAACVSWLSRIPGLFNTVVDTVRGGVAPGDYGALTSWLALPANRDSYPLALVAIVGRQGCSRADSSRLRDELRAAREKLATTGIRSSRMYWEGFVDDLEANARVVNDATDLFRLAVLGQLGRGQARHEALLTEARTNDQALAVILEWMASGTVDEAALLAQAETFDPQASWSHDFDAIGPWLVFAKPSERARALLKEAQKARKKDLRRRGSDGDGDFAEYVQQKGAALELLNTVVASWDGVVPPAELAHAFRVYYEHSLDYYKLRGPVAATFLEMWLAGQPLRPTDALARLRAFVPPMTPPPDPLRQAAPALRAIDAAMAKLALGNGLTVRADRDLVELSASPQEVSGDFI